jgi:Protein of unknown function (DUF3558)
MIPQTLLLTGRSHVLGGFRSFVLGLSCVLSACAGPGSAPGDKPSSAATQAAPQVSSAGLDPCALVTSAEATQALGAAVGPAERPKEANHPPRMATCRYVASHGQGVAVMSVLVQLSDTANQAQRGFQSAKEQFPGAEVVPGLGDDAFAVANQLNVLKGTVYLNITGDFDLATSKTLAQSALERLR